MCSHFYLQNNHTRTACQLAFIIPTLAVNTRELTVTPGLERYCVFETLFKEKFDTLKIHLPRIRLHRVKDECARVKSKENEIPHKRDSRIYEIAAKTKTAERKKAGLVASLLLTDIATHEVYSHIQSKKASQITVLQ